jgi:hypothetical protein
LLFGGQTPESVCTTISDTQSIADGTVSQAQSDAMWSNFQRISIVVETNEEQLEKVFE